MEMGVDFFIIVLEKLDQSDNFTVTDPEILKSFLPGKPGTVSHAYFM